MKTLKLSRYCLWIIPIALVALAVAALMTSTPQRVKAANQEGNATVFQGNATVVQGNATVVLGCNGVDSTTTCTSWTRYLENGTSAPFTAIGHNEVLVITDLEFADVSREANAGGFAQCSVLNAPAGNAVLLAAAKADPNMNVIGSTHSVTGVPMRHVPSVVCNGLYQQLPSVNIILRGYETGE
jgi:hypothetical protein